MNADPRSRLVLRLSPPTNPNALSSMVVIAGDLWVTLSVYAEPDGDALRIVTDAPRSGVVIRSESIWIDPDAAWGDR